MEQIIKVYGQYLLDAIVVTLLMALLFTQIQDDEGNKGILQIIGSWMHLAQTDYDNYCDFDKYAAEAAKALPEITYTASGELKIGTNKLTDFIQAVDHNGDSLTVNLTSVINPDGTEIISSYLADTTEISLDTAGIYTFTVWAVDDGNRRNTAVIMIPVNEG